MASVLRLNNTDQRIAFSEHWAMVANSGFSQASTDGANFFFLFRGMGHTKWHTRCFSSLSWSLIRLYPGLRYKRQSLWPYGRRWREVGLLDRR